MSEGIGSKRLVTGAHYGLRDWMAQRLTAALMALFTALVLFQVIFSRGEIGYDLWAGIFSPQWMRALTFTVLLALTYHVWVGMRDMRMRMRIRVHRYGRTAGVSGVTRVMMMRVMMPRMG